MFIPTLQNRSTPADNTSMSSTTLNLLIALLVLLFVALLCCATLMIIRRVRTRRAIARQSLPQYNELPSSPYNKRLTINVYDEKASILSNPSSPPLSPNGVPEIRITFPDEQDETTGRRKSGRVLVVRVGETGIGLEPMGDEEQLPAYQKEGDRESFQDVDMDRIGGLKEKKDIYS